MLHRAVASLLLVSNVHALRIGGVGTQQRVTHSAVAADKCKAALVAAFSAASLMATPPAFAQTLDEAIVDVSQSSYPILKALRAETFVPFSEKIGKLLLDIPKDKLGKSLGLGVDMYNSVPADKVTALNEVVTGAFADLKPDSCTLVPLPSASVAEKFTAIAGETVDPAKLKAFGEAWGPTLSALPKTDAGICLPSSASLDKLALAQADIGRSFGAGEGKAFATATTATLKSKLSLGTLLPLVKDAEKLAPTATAAEKARFQTAGKNIERVSKIEAAQQAQQARVAAAAAKSSTAATAAASKPASKPVPAVDPAEAAAAREAARAQAAARAEEAAAKKAAAAEQAAAQAAAAREEAAAKREALAAAEVERIAELKAKSAAIKAAKEAAN